MAKLLNRTCKLCKIKFKVAAKKVKYDLKRKRRGSIFCSRSCGVKYNNKNKTTGTCRSKLEFYVCERISQDYPDLRIQACSIVCGWEIDIYLPDHKLGFEIQGIFHREPIFGQERLDSAQKNDKLKKQACRLNKIKLYQIDDNYKRFTIANGEEFYLQYILPKLKKLK